MGPNICEWPAIMMFSTGYSYAYSFHNSCWISVESGAIWAFAAPMLVVIIVSHATN